MSSRLAGLRRSLRTVRGRSTVLSMVVVCLAMIAALSAVLVLYRGQLENNLDQTLEQQVADRARLLIEGSSPDSLTTVLAEESLVWIGTTDGEAMAIGGDIVPLENPVPATIGGVTSLELLVDEHKPNEIERERMQLRVASVNAADGIVVLAGAEAEVVDKAVNQLGILFLVALPLLTVMVGATTWVVTGRVLAPVEEMRSRADQITGANLHSRVPVPDTDDEINHLALTMNSMLDRIESHDRALRDFTADASHELKSPVANLRALVDTNTLTDPEWQSLRDRLVGETDRLRDLVENLLFLASHQAGAPVEPGDAVNLDDLLFDEAEMLAATGRVSVDLTDVEPATVTGSRSDLARLIRNLVDNASRHAAGRVRLAAVNRGATIVLTIGDDGPGVPIADRERVFERFTRLDEARARDDGGSGLGLAIVDQIATDHGATVEISEANIGGAQFDIIFPT